MIEILGKIFTHEYFMAFYGVFVYYAIIWSLAKNKAERAKQKFNWKKWKTETKDNFIVTLLIVPLVIIFDDEIVMLYNNFMEKDIVMGKYIYIMAGPLTDFIFRGVQKLRKHESH
jgi:hypothetical protein